MIDTTLHAVAHFGRDINMSCLVASAAGFLSHHLYFIRGIRDMEVRNIIFGHIIALSLLFFKTVSTAGLSQGVVTYIVISTAYFVSLFSSILVYRLFFHPLRRFPGPIGVVISHWYVAWMGWGGKLHREYVQMHEQYGDFVRVGE